jgi:hypothetical protein
MLALGVSNTPASSPINITAAPVVKLIHLCVEGARPLPSRQCPNQLVQAAGQLVDELTRKGYLRRMTVEEDRRQKLIVLTDRGEDCLRQSAAIFAELHAEWAQHVGTERLRDLDRDLNTLLTLYQRPGQGLRPVW